MYTSKYIYTPTHIYIQQHFLYTQNLSLQVQARFLATPALISVLHPDFQAITGKVQLCNY